MDHSVEAILAASDSDEGEGSESYLDTHGVSLEDILREDDGDSDDDDGDGLDATHALVKGLFAPLGSPLRLGPTFPCGSSVGDGGASDDGDSDYDAGGGGGSRGRRTAEGESRDNRRWSSEGEYGWYGAAGSGSAGGLGNGNGGSGSGVDDGGFGVDRHLERHDSAEDSKLLQQILRESEEDHNSRSQSRPFYGHHRDAAASSTGRRPERGRTGNAGSEVDWIIDAVDMDDGVRLSPCTPSGGGGDGAFLHGGGDAGTDAVSGDLALPQRSGDVTGAATTAAGRPAVASPSTTVSAAQARLGSAHLTGLASATASAAAATAAAAAAGGAAEAVNWRQRPSAERAPARGAGGGVAARPGPEAAAATWERDPLAAAEARELRLLRAGNIDVISPLQVKRRMRVGQHGVAPLGGAAGAAQQAGGGMVRLDDLGGISAQLSKHAAYRQHGPGLPTALAVQAKFIALGTSRGLVLLFDHFHEIRHVLGTADGGSGADTGSAGRATGGDGRNGSAAAGNGSTGSGGGGNGDGGVTSLDMCAASDMLVVGYQSGRVALWNFMQGVLLKTVVDAHESPIVTVRCCHPSEPQVVTADARGVVNKITFRRVMWTAWVGDIECLLDGAAGSMPALCTLPWWLAPPGLLVGGGGGSGLGDGGSSGSGAGSVGGDGAVPSAAAAAALAVAGRLGASIVGTGGAAGGGGSGLLRAHGARLLAMSSWKSTFIVALEPKIKVVHRWPRPEVLALPNDAADLSASTPAVDTAPCIAWGWPHRSDLLPGSPVVVYLARGWGTTLQLLLASSEPILRPARTRTPRSPGMDAGRDLRPRNGSVSVSAGHEDPATATGVTGTAGGAAAGHGPSGGAVAAVAAVAPMAAVEVVMEKTLGAAVMAVEWLSESNLAYLTAAMDLCILDVKMATELERMPLGGDAAVPTLHADPRRSRPDSSGTAVVYQNTFRACDARLYVLGRERLRAAKVQGWVQRIDGLIVQGEWLEALAVALDHYEEHIRPLELERGTAKDGSAGATGQRLSGRLVTAASALKGGKGPGVGSGGPGVRGGSAAGAPRLEGVEQIAEILMRYVRLAVENAPKGNRQHDRVPARSKRPAIDLVHSHFQMLAGVCVEFCVVTGMLDVLYGEVTRRFTAAGHLTVLLDTVEPYVLAGKLRYLAPDALRAVAEHCQARGDMTAFERCLLHLDKASLDSAAALALCRKHSLRTGLLHVYSSGLGDYVTPLDALLRELMAMADSEHSRRLLDAAAATKTAPAAATMAAATAAAATAAAAGSGTSRTKEAAEGLLEGGGTSATAAPEVAAALEAAAAAAASARIPVVLHRPPGPAFEALGYKILLYIRWCFEGRGFPSGAIPEAARACVRAVLLYLLIQEELSPPASAAFAAPGNATAEALRCRQSEAGTSGRGGRFTGSLGAASAAAGPRRHSAGLGERDVAALLDAAVESHALDGSAAAAAAAAAAAMAASAPAAAAAAAAAPAGPWTSAPLPYLRILLYLDARRTLETLQVALDSPDALFDDASQSDNSFGGRGGGARQLSADATAPVPPGASSNPAALVDTGGRAPERRRWEERGITTLAAAGLRLRSCPSRRRVITAVSQVLAPRLVWEGTGDAATTALESGLHAAALAAAVPAAGRAISSEAPSALKPAVALPVTAENGGGGGGATATATATQDFWRQAGTGAARAALVGRDGQAWPAAEEPLLFEFVAKYVEMSLVRVTPALTNAILAYQCSERAVEAGPAAAQARLVNLLHRVNIRAVDRKILLPMAEKVGFYRVAVMLLKAAPTETHPSHTDVGGLGGSQAILDRGRLVAGALSPPEQFERIIQCYLHGDDDAFRSQVFSFIHNEVSHAVAAWEAQAAVDQRALQQGEPADGAAGAVASEGVQGIAAASLSGPNSSGGGGGFSGVRQDPRAVLLSELPALMTLDTPRAVRVMTELFGPDPSRALGALAADPLKQFEYLDCLLYPERGAVSSAGPSSGGGGIGGTIGGGGGAGSGSGGGGAPAGSRSATAGMAGGFDEGGAAAAAAASHLGVYMRLLIRFRPHEVYPYLSTHDNYSLDECLSLCQAAGITDATAYLLERGGDVGGALRLTLRTLRERLVALKIVLRTVNLRQLAASAGGSADALLQASAQRSLKRLTEDAGTVAGMPGRNGGGGGVVGSRVLSRLALERLQEGRELTWSLSVALELCQRACPLASGIGGFAAAATAAPAAATAVVTPGAAAAGGGGGGGGAKADASHALWFALLDEIIAAKGMDTKKAAVRQAAISNAAIIGGGASPNRSDGGGGGFDGSGGGLMAGELPQLVAVMDGVLDTILSTVLDGMAGYVPLPAIVGKILLDHAGNTVGEFRHILLSMLETYAYETSIYSTAASLVFDHMTRLSKERSRMGRAGVRVSSLAGAPLPPLAPASAAGVAARPAWPVRVGSSVISVSLDGRADVERLGESSVGLEADYTGRPTGGSATDEAERRRQTAAALWRLKAARRRRQQQSRGVGFEIAIDGSGSGSGGCTGGGGSVGGGDTGGGGRLSRRSSHRGMAADGAASLHGVGPCSVGGSGSDPVGFSGGLDDDFQEAAGGAPASWGLRGLAAPLQSVRGLALGKVLPSRRA